MKGKKIALAFLVFVMAITFIPITPVSAASKINHKKYTLYVGKTVKLKVTGAKKVKWSSSNKKVATVTKKGVVKGKKKGTAIIKAKVGRKTFKCKVTVKKNSENEFTEEKFEEVLNGIYIEKYTAPKGYVKIVNISGYDVYCGLEWILKDSSGVIVDRNEYMFELSDREGTYVGHYSYDGSGITTTIRINKLRWDRDIVFKYNLSAVKESEDEKDISFLFKNPSNKECDLCGAWALFKKDDEVVSVYDCGIFRLYAGETISIKIPKPEIEDIHGDKTIMDYDDVEIAFLREHLFV